MRARINVRLFVFLILISSVLSAQNLKLGFQVEATQYYANKEVIERLTNTTVSSHSSAHGAFLPTSLYLKLDFGITDKIMLGLKPGFLFSDDYTGLEAGIFSKYNIYRFISLIAFYNYHSNIAHSSNTGGATSKGISFLGTGIGFNIIESIVVELLYSIPINESQIGYTPDYLNDYTLRTETSLKSIIKLGIGFSWNIAELN